MQAVLNEQASKWNCSFSYGFAAANDTIALVAGTQDIWAGKPMTTADMIPMGSVTKSWTTVGVMQYAEAGAINLDEKASKYVDPVLNRLNGTTLTGLFGPRAAEITVRHLLSMTSGIGDYDDEDLFDWTIFTAAEDFSPLDYLAVANKVSATYTSILVH